MRSPAHVLEDHRRRLPLILVRSHIVLVAVMLVGLTGVIRDPDAPTRIEAVDPGPDQTEPDWVPSVVDEVPAPPVPSFRSAPVPTTAASPEGDEPSPADQAAGGAPPKRSSSTTEVPATADPVAPVPDPDPGGADPAGAMETSTEASTAAGLGGDGSQPANGGPASSAPSGRSAGSDSATAPTTAGGVTGSSSTAEPSVSALSATTTTTTPTTTTKPTTTGPTSGASDRSTTTAEPRSTTSTTTTTDPTTASTRQTTSTSRPTTTTTTRPTTITTTTTTTTRPTTSTADDAGVNAGLEQLRNHDPRFVRYAAVPSVDLSLSALTEPAPVPDNGTVGDGQFRMACQYSHFGYDDPIVYPGQPGRAHLHMFFGNTETDAFSTTDSLVNRGGGTCNGFELNRSGYWTPALLDGKGSTVVPEQIILYYKTKQPDRVQRMPQGLKMIAGNTSSSSFTVSDYLAWSCGDSGRSYNRSNQIPDCGGDMFNAAIAFPQCWDGRNLDSADHRSHMATVSPHADCPSSHPVRLPQITILLYFEGVPSVAGWHLSSDHHGGLDAPPGGTLHADWWGGWNDEAMDLWIDGCMKAARNCSYGQTGTPRMLAKLNAFQNFPGGKFLPLP